jgi:hypothetical protein
MVCLMGARSLRDVRPVEFPNGRNDRWSRRYKRWSLFAPWGVRHESKELTGAGANLEFS